VFKKPSPCKRTLKDNFQDWRWYKKKRPKIKAKHGFYCVFSSKRLRVLAHSPPLVAKLSKISDVRKKIACFIEKAHLLAYYHANIIICYYANILAYSFIILLFC